MLRAMDGGLDGLLVMGQNPAVGSQHSGLQRRALAKLKWLVVRDLSELETATFWKDGPEVRSGELRTEDIGTEIFLMPAASHVEKDGHFTNTQRLLQWHDKALEPPGEARSELWFMHHIFKRVRAHYAGSERERDWPIVNLHWDYPENGELREPDAEAVLREINGYDVASGEPVNGFAQLKADGSTACGCWIYSGCYADGVNQTRRRDPGDLESEGGWVSPEWAWAWPANRRILYNRASADPAGRPWSERKKYVWWDEAAGKWTGYDVPDFPADKRPDYVAPDDATGMDAISGAEPFIMMADGRGWLYAPAGLLDGPLPAHYEPYESPVANAIYPDIGRNPAALSWNRPDNPEAATGDPRYPIVATTFRLTEHHTAGRDEPQPAVARRAAAGDVRGDRPDPGRRPRHRGRRLDGDRDRARGDRGARPRHRAHAPAAHRRQAAAPDRAALALGLRGRRSGRRHQRPGRAERRPQRVDPGGQGVLRQRPCGAAAGRDDREAGRRPRGQQRRTGHRRPVRGPGQRMTELAIERDDAQRMGFFTDTTVCIGCKACEVACKQWNDLPSDGGEFRKGGSYDNTNRLSGNTWRHVRFVELADAGGGVSEEELPDLVAWAGETVTNGGEAGGNGIDVEAAVAAFDNWVFMSDVCKHCTNAGCLDACPTGALIRTEFETVVLQPDVCNGCGYCIPACPFGVVDRVPEDGRAGKCTLCYDRLEDGLEPACAKACPTDSIQFGPYDELVDVASRRVATLHARGVEGAYLYGAADAPEEQLAGGLGAFFLLTEKPERYGLPAQAESPIQENVVPATLAAMGAGLLAAAGVAAAFLWERRG